MDLRHIQLQALGNVAHDVGMLVDEYTHFDEVAIEVGNPSSFICFDIARAFKVKIEAESVGPGIHRRLRVTQIGDAANLH